MLELEALANPGFKFLKHQSPNYIELLCALNAVIKTSSQLDSGGASLLSQHSGGRGRWISEFVASLVYRVSSRTARATQRNPVSKNQGKKVPKADLKAELSGLAVKPQEQEEMRSPHCRDTSTQG